MKSVVRVGIGVLVRKGNQVLLGKRKNAYGDGMWASPGGHLELGESFEDCARREVAEEVGFVINNVQFGAVTNDIFTKDNKHYVTILVVADYAKGLVRNQEPEKCERWEWFAWKVLPQPLFVPLVNALQQHFNPMQLKPYDVITKKIGSRTTESMG